MAFLSTVSHVTLYSDLLTRLWIPSVTQLRYNRPNLQRPLPVHYKKKRMDAVCKPRYPEPPKFCKKDTEPLIGSTRIYSLERKPYHQFVARELRNKIANHPMVAIFHTNVFSQHEFLAIQGMLFDVKFDMKVFYDINHIIAHHALQGTKFEPMLQLIHGRTSFGYCMTTDVAKLLRVLKKMPQFILIGLVMENRLLHRSDVDKIAKLPNIDILRGQLCATLNLVGQSLSNTLQTSQLSLVNNLRIHSTSDSKDS